MRIGRIIFLTVGLLACNQSYPATPDAGGIVIVGTSVGTGTDSEAKRVSIGFVVDDHGHIIAHFQPKTPNQIFSVQVSAGVSIKATAIEHDTASGLTLLKARSGVENLYPFALDPAQPQRKVFAIKVPEDPLLRHVIGGALSKVQQPEPGIHPGYYLHNAVVGKRGAGGPLFNNCGEVVGVMVPHKKKFLQRLFGGSEENTAYAVTTEWLINRFNAHGINPQRVATPCLSEVAQAAAAQVELEEESRRATEAAQATATAQAELDAVKDRLAAAQEGSEEERQRLEAEVVARQNAVDEARARETAAQGALEAAQNALQETRRAAQVREQEYKKWGAIGAAALLLILILVWGLKQRTVARERREKVAAKIHAEQAEAQLDAREQVDARIRQTPTVFFEGADPTGQTIALRIPGTSIAAAEGAVVGRNPGGSDFVINHPQVSRRQFRVFTAATAADKERALLMLEDLGSTNGTTVDGKKLGAGDETILADLSRVQLSDLSLTVRLEHTDNK